MLHYEIIRAGEESSAASRAKKAAWLAWQAAKRSGDRTAIQDAKADFDAAHERYMVATAHSRAITKFDKGGPLPLCI